MTTTITEEEKQYIDYIEDNKRFLIGFNDIYCNQYKQILNGYKLKDYMITARIQMNKLKGYSNYEEFYYVYLEALGGSDITLGEAVYSSYYEAFKENMDDEIQKLKQQFKKDDYEIYIAYTIKTIWNFYIGFIVEKLVKAEVNKEKDIIILQREGEQQQLIDNTMAIDIELRTLTAKTIGLQIKSHTYLKIKSEKKDIHIQKQNKYKAKYNSEVYYVLHKDHKPIYKITTQSYLFTQNDIKQLQITDTAKGTYEGLINDLRYRMK